MKLGATPNVFTIMAAAMLGGIDLGITRPKRKFHRYHRRRERHHTQNQGRRRT